MTYLAVGIVAVLMFAGGLTAFLVNRTPSSSAATQSQVLPSTPVGEVTVQQPVRLIPDSSGIAGVLAWDTGEWPGEDSSTALGIIEHDHVAGPVTYSVTPPVGGPHNPIWMNAGVYADPIPAERAVHNLEHGAVWITYRPGLSTAEVADLTAFVDSQSLIDESGATGIRDQQSRYVDMSPWPSDDLPAPIVISAWGHQLRVDNASDPRLQQFVDRFRNSSAYSPEYGEAVDGVPIQTGGRAAADGATKPNPPGAAGSEAGMPGG